MPGEVNKADSIKKGWSMTQCLGKKPLVGKMSRPAFGVRVVRRGAQSGIGDDEE
jgi:hypothetical protein